MVALKAIVIATRTEFEGLFQNHTSPRSYPAMLFTLFDNEISKELLIRSGFFTSVTSTTIQWQETSLQKHIPYIKAHDTTVVMNSRTLMVTA